MVRSFNPMVMPFLAAANRDPGQFAEAARLDIGREDDRHMAVGWSIHFCLGAPLAPVEGRSAIDALVQRMPTLPLASDKATWRFRLTQRGLLRVPATS